MHCQAGIRTTLGFFVLALLGWDRIRAYDAAMQRLMNKVSLVTLWVEPKAHQIVKYTFANLPFDFLPGAWLMRRWRGAANSASTRTTCRRTSRRG